MESKIAKPVFSFLIIAILVASATFVNAQLSPGDLSQQHAELEGISNCTQCHTLGKKISSDKCLACHDNIKSLVDNGKGYHSSGTVRNQDCFACHSEHHGRKFEMIRFDTEAFDHDLTGYKLHDAHARIACAECHKQKFIADKSLTRRDGTFLGLEQACLSCHDDFHQSTMSSDCKSCHNTAAFRPAELFDHSNTDFPLAGQHMEVECVKCHEMTIRNGREIQQFASIEFQNCNACHDDAHESRFGIDCKRCHDEESFQAVAGRINFDHNTTEFPLRGQHQRIDCASCHEVGGDAQIVFKDFIHLDVINCTNCHDDIHESKFGEDCRSCHNENSFKELKAIEEFDHALTAFRLEGMHTQVDCRECHQSDMTDPVPHNQCISCHSDYHEGQFVQAGMTIQDCSECHSTEGFEGSLVTIDRHNAGAFKLEGAHLATPCFACHLKEKKWEFREIGLQCADCHENIHQGYLSQDYYPKDDCTTCHTVDRWSSVDFDHELTSFDLTGSHLTTSCVACHLQEDTSTSMAGLPFSGLSAECSACHEDEHHGQFVSEGITDCSRCHQPQHWKPSQFDHRRTQFVLDGEHLQVACDACHKEVTENNITFIQYKIADFECATCHQ